MNFEHPAFAPYRLLIDELRLTRAKPSLARLNAAADARRITQSQGLPLRFAAPAGRLSARAYETHILEAGEVPTRTETWHDVLNALVWLRFPRFKAALNAVHGDALRTEVAPARGPRRDAVTVLDESGVWVSSGDAALSTRLAERAWRAVFWESREAVTRDMCFVVVGHALLEKALLPYPAMTGKCLMLDTVGQQPEVAAVKALATLRSPRELSPLPIQGIPGWDPANAEPGFYDNAKVFRPARV